MVIFVLGFWFCCLLFIWGREWNNGFVVIIKLEWLEKENFWGNGYVFENYVKKMLD